MSSGNAMKEIILLKVTEAIKNIKRPLTSNELELYIRGKDENVWQMLKSKPRSYLKTIVNIECPRLYYRYKTVEHIRGIDKRAIFFGLADKTYPAEKWLLIEKKFKKSVLNEEKQVPQCEQLFTFPNVNISEHFVEATSEETGNVWNYLIKTIPKNDPTWNQLLNAINDISKASKDGYCNSLLLNQIFCVYNLLNNPLNKHNFEIILSREIILKRNQKY